MPERALHTFSASFIVLALMLSLSLADDVTVPPTPSVVNWDFTEWVQVGSTRFVLETNTLGDVEKMLKAGQIERLGEPNDADYVWVVRFRSGPNIIAFEADSDMGGDEHRLTGVTISSASASPTLSQLPILPGTIRFPFGGLGMSFSHLERRLGRAKLQSGIASYQYPGRSTIPNRSDLRAHFKIFDVSGYLQVQVVKGSVASLSASHITTD